MRFVRVSRGDGVGGGAAACSLFSPRGEGGPQGRMRGLHGTPFIALRLRSVHALLSSLTPSSPRYRSGTSPHWGEEICGGAAVPLLGLGAAAMVRGVCRTVSRPFAGLRAFGAAIDSLDRSLPLCGTAPHPPVTLICRATAGRLCVRSMMKSWPLGLRVMASSMAARRRASSSVARSAARRSAASFWPRHM